MGKLTLSLGLYAANSSPESAALSSLPGLIDGVLTTHAGDQYWQGGDQYGFDLGSAAEVSSIRLFSLTSSGQMNATWDDLAVYKSSDNSTWTLVESFEGATDCTVVEETGYCWWDIVLSAPATARYFKVYSSSGIAFGAGGASASVSEIEAYVSVANSKILSIDHTKIDSDLTDFPIAIDLEQHVPDIFSDLGTDKLKLKVEVEDSVTKLLIHSDTTDGSTTFTDSSSSAHTITANGSIHHETDQKKFGTTSIYFDGVGDTLSIPASSDFDHSSGDFTIDFWMNPDSHDTFRNLYGFLTGGNVGFGISCSTSGIIRVFTNGGWQVTTTLTADIGTWTHVAIVKDSTGLDIAINGVFTGTRYTGAITNNNDVVRIGDIYTNPSSNLFQGYLDEFRVSKGIARWTSDFTPPTLPYSLECPVEIENWDDTNSKGVIHTKVSLVSSSSDTEITISWNDSWDDNTDYVGVTGSTPAEAVWDSNFVAVYHMAQDPSGGADCILDSTSNVNHGTSAGTMTSTDLVDGLMGKAIDFDGSNDNINGLPDVPQVNTLEVLFNADALENTSFLSWDKSGGNHTYDFKFGIKTAGNLKGMWDTDTEDGTEVLSTGSVNNSEWTLGTVKQTSDTFSFYRDGTNDGDHSIQAHLSGVSSGVIADPYTDGYSATNFDGKIAEIRISEIARSDAWIKATNASLKDELFISGGTVAVRLVDKIRLARVINSNSYLILGGI